MSKRIVPTPVKLALCVNVEVEMRKTSKSGSEKGTGQLRPSSSCHVPEIGLNLTISPVSGPAVPAKLVFGAGRPPGPDPHGGALAPPSHTCVSLSAVVRFPESNTAAYTLVPSGLTARARGVSPKSVMTLTGLPSRLVPRFAGLNTHTSARPTPCVVSDGFTASVEWLAEF